MLNLLKIHSVGKRIAVTFALIMPIVVYQLGKDAYELVQRYRDARTVAQQNTAANNLIAGVYEILMERLATNNALQAEPPAGPTELKEIDTRRTAAVRKIASAYDELNAQDFPNKAALLGELKSAIDKANGYRSKADAALKKDKGERDVDTLKNLFVALSELSATSQKVWSATLASTASLDPELGRLANIRLIAWNLRDIAGFERSHVAQSIAAKSPIPSDKLSAIGEVRTQLALLRKMLAVNLKTSDHPSVTKGVKLAEEGYYGKFQPLADQMRKLSSEGAPYPMSLQQWVDTTTPQLFTLLEIMYGAGEASEAHTASLESAAVRGMFLNIGLLLLGLGVGAAAIWMAVRSIARPLADLVGVIGRLGVQGEGVRVPHTDRQDEIGHMARALLQFRDAAGEKARLASETAQQRDQTEAERRQNAAAQAKAAEEQAAVMRSLAEGLGKLTEGDLTFRLGDGFTEAYLQIRDDFNATIAQLQDTIRAIALSTREVASTAGGDLDQHDRPVPAHRGAGREPGADLGLDGGDLRDREEERRERPAGQSVRHRHPRGRRPRRRRGGAGGDRDGADRGVLAQDLRHHRRDRRDRAADQPAGAQRGGGGGARRRGGPRLRGGGLGSAQPGAALVAGGQGHQGPDHQQLGAGAGGRANWSTGPAPRSPRSWTRSSGWRRSCPRSPPPAPSRRPGSIRSTSR